MFLGFFANYIVGNSFVLIIAITYRLNPYRNKIHENLDADRIYCVNFI